MPRHNNVDTTEPTQEVLPRDVAPANVAQVNTGAVNPPPVVAPEVADVPAATHLVAPLSAEDPSRGLVPAPAAGRSFPGFPKTKYHPVYGGRQVADPNEEAGLLPAHNWFNTPEEADAHRTDREAQAVIHYNTRVKVDGSLNGAPATEVDNAAVLGDAGIVRNSVSATERLKTGFPEPL